MGLAWFRPDDHPYKAGWPFSPIEEGPEGAGRFIDDYVPAGHTFAYMHDNLVGSLTSRGIPDWLANIPTMLPTYAAAVGRETLNSGLKVFGNNLLEHQLTPTASQQGSSAARGGCSPKCF